MKTGLGRGRVGLCFTTRCYYCDRELFSVSWETDRRLDVAKRHAAWRNALTCGACSGKGLPVWKPNASMSYVAQRFNAKRNFLRERNAATVCGEASIPHGERGA